MQVDNVLILAAGKGTRMGEIGKKVPKVIWPIFEKSMLELEVLYAQTFSPQKIFINVYHYKDVLKSHMEKSSVFDEVTIVEEEEVLDIGGAIHNIAEKLNYEGNLLVINSDQFLLLTEDVKKKIKDKIHGHDSVLLSYTVSRSEGYNALFSKDDLVKKIIPNKEMDQDEFETYIGMSLIKLSNLNPIPGESKFFDTVADLKNKRIAKVNIEDSIYWDFGTLKRYYDSMFKLCEEVSVAHKAKNIDRFVSFLLDSKALSPSLVKRNSYNSDIENVINLSNQEVCIENTIYLSRTEKYIEESSAIVHGDDLDYL